MIKRTKYDHDLTPVNVLKTASDLGVRVEPLPPQDSRYSGMYKRDHNGFPTAFFNEADSQLRQRFTIAHELGHHVLRHGDSLIDPAVNFSASTSDPQEAAANQFAAELLMPSEIVQFMIEREGMNSIQSLSKTFKVSEVAIQYRLKNLRLIP